MTPTPAISQRGSFDFALTVPVLVIGGGGCGLTAAMAARDGGAEVLIVERDARLWGTTSMSTGLIPAAGTPEQAAKSIDDSPARFADDIMLKTGGATDPAIALRLAEQSAETIDWLVRSHGIGLSHIDDFCYPGHSAMRMHGMPNRSGSELMAALEAAAVAAGVDVLTQARAATLFIDGDRISGVRVVRADGRHEDIGCTTLILACCGFGGNVDMVRRFMPELEHAVFHGHPGNKGDAVRWGDALGARLADLHSYQGHGGLAAGHAIPILWPLIMEGGYQVNCAGDRFSDESKGYSEQAVEVLAQPGHIAWSIFDARLHTLMMRFDDFQQAVAAGAVVGGDTLDELAQECGIDPAALLATNAAVDAAKAGSADAFGRDFIGKPPLAARFYAAKVTGALFHTQGGIVVDGNARALRRDGSAFANLYAGGGAARGISGPGCDGYLAGNGLLTATTLGKLAGRHAAAALRERLA